MVRFVASKSPASVYPINPSIRFTHRRVPLATADVQRNEHADLLRFEFARRSAAVALRGEGLGIGGVVGVRLGAGAGGGVGHGAAFLAGGIGGLAHVAFFALLGGFVAILFAATFVGVCHDGLLF